MNSKRWGYHIQINAASKKKRKNELSKEKVVDTKNRY